VVRLTAIVLVALGAAGGAWAAAPGMGTLPSAASPDGKLVYKAVAKHGRTTLELRRNGRSVTRVRLHGNLGFPAPTNSAIGEGLSHDGRTLVLANAGTFGRFTVLGARTLHVRRTITLHGQFTYDALSPTASTLFLIQHLSSGTVDRYNVRAYDLVRGRLLEQIIFDRREESSVMTGWAIARATGPTGRWVYTLYGRQNGSLFVHALDTVDRHAYCVDLPHRSSNPSLSKLQLRPGRLLVATGTKRLAVIDTRTLRLRD
jgi:hypothetical protein